MTVDQLKIWNELDGDLIEVGQELKIFHVETAPTASIQPVRRTGAPQGTDAEGPKLVMPTPEPCLEGPELEGTADEEMVASAGLPSSRSRGR